MELALTFDGIWHVILVSVQDHKFLASVLIVLVFWALKRLTFKLIKKRSKRKGEDRRHQLTLLEQLGNAFVLVLLMVVWSSEIQSLAISIAAFMVAIILATREFIQCFMGFIYYLGARPFRVGDWIQMNQLVGEVVEMDWAKTTLLEVDPDSFTYTGKHVYIPNSQLVTQTIRNLNFLRRYTLHSFNLTNEPEVNAYQLVPEFKQRATEHCSHFRDVAERYKAVIERHLDAEFIDIDPDISIETNQFAKLIVTVSLFCPTSEAHALQQKISADWLSLWYEALTKQNASTNRNNSALEE